MKVLHLPTPTTGNSWGLAQGERALGLDSFVMIAQQSWHNYPADIYLHLESIPSIPGKFAKLAISFFNIRDKYDVFHFNFGNSLIYIPYQLKQQLPTLFKYVDQLDLPFYPDTAKLFVTYNGCDVRQKYMTMQRTPIAACHNPNCYAGRCNSGRLDEYRRQGVKKMERYARHMWALTPDLLYFLPKEKSSFLPCTISNWSEVELCPPKLKKKLKIVHAPTNREAKGSDFILAAFEKIRRTHADFVEIQLVENISHVQALQIYRDADLIIDQILIGWYGAFAVEAMKMGKPVIARIAQEDLQFVLAPLAHDVMETIINADPSSIYEVLLRCIENRNFLRQQAQASLDYVYKWHHPQYVAGLTKEKYETA
jgi:hypothetical protein